MDLTTAFIQLLDEVEHDTENYHAEVSCYLPKPKAEADNTSETEAVIILGIMRKTESNNCFIIQL